MFNYLHFTGVVKVTHKATKEMKKYHLDDEILNELLSNPSLSMWTLDAQPSAKFYCDLHFLLKQKRVPIEEVGFLYRCIDDAVRKKTKSSYDAYSMIADIASKYAAGNVVEFHSDGSTSETEDEPSKSIQYYSKRNVRR